MALSERSIKGLLPKEKAYKAHDAGGLYLLVTPSGSKLWRFDYRYGGKRKTIALGRWPEVSLLEARERMIECKKMLAQGIDPSAARKEKKLRQRLTFEALAEEFLERKKAVWSPKHWEKNVLRLRKHVLPRLGPMPVTALSAPVIASFLREMEAHARPETARRCMQLIGQIIRYAVATGRAQADPTPALRGLIKVPENHFPAATTPGEFAGILRAVWDYRGSIIVRNALRFLVYTFQRPGEVCRMRWEDVDLERAEWRFRLSKTGREHLVPLSRQALSVLEEMKVISDRSPYVFPSIRSFERPLTVEALEAALKRIGITDHVPHGFRASARTLLHEVLKYEPDVIEHQLGHAVPDRLGEAYNRTRFLEERRRMMQDWADYVDRLTGSFPAI